MRARTAGRASHSPVKAAIYLCRAVVALLLALVRDWPAQFEDGQVAVDRRAHRARRRADPGHAEPTTDARSRPEARP